MFPSSIRSLLRARVVGMVYGLAIWLIPFGLEIPSAAQTQEQTAAPSSQNPASPAVVSLPPAGTAAVPNPLGEALSFYHKGDFPAAVGKYQEVLRMNPKSPDAYAGLARAYLRQRNVSRALEEANRGLSLNDAPRIRVALGEIYFRQGKIHEAEHEWVQAINSGDPEARAFLGLSRVRNALSLYQQGKAMIDRAHDLDSSDPEITRAWMRTLPRSDRIRYLEKHLAEPNSDDPETRAETQVYLDRLKALASEPGKHCHLVGTVSSTETDLVRLLMDPEHIRGYGLAVNINGRKSNLMLDTGAGGILVDRRIAEKAGIDRMLNTKVGGIGDKGNKSGYVGLANSIKIGDLEFQDCPVEVLEKRSVVGEEGLIGANVFGDFLVDLDFPKEKLRLSQLPRRPDDPATPAGLHTEGGSSGLSDDDPGSDGGSSSADSDKGTDSAAGKLLATSPLFRDGYIAPEMKSYTRVYRFGHMVLVPTAVGDVPGRLFLMDTGALENHITPAAAREVTKVHGDNDTTVEGLSGRVKNVYSADKAVLQFGHLRQENQDLLTFNLDSISDDVGTEISGTLGFVLLHLLDLKIDYRDNLVDFNYEDPTKRFNKKK